VRKIDDLHDAERKRQAGAEETVDAAEKKARHNRLKDEVEVHAMSLIESSETLFEQGDTRRGNHRL
jgi:hypothetical protein